MFMMMAMRHYVRIATFLAGTSLWVQAQWLNNPDPKAPRTADGKVNMTGPVPRVGGKPDLSGVWQIEAGPRGPGLYGLGESTNSPFFGNILAGFKPDEQPLTPAGTEMFRKNRQGTGTKNPQSYCLPDGVPHGILLPEPFKIVQMPVETIFLYEVETIYRQIYTDGRKLPNPDDVRPTWYGYSVGSWDGDTFVVDTLGFNDLGWLDAGGHGHSEDLRVQERFTRRDFGHLDVAVTITDPKTFTKSFTINFVERLLPDTDVFEHICLEDEKDVAHTPK